MAKKSSATPKIGAISAVFMIMTALLFDLAQFAVTFLHAIPVVGNGAAIVLAWFITILSLATFGLWFALAGINYFSGKGAGRRLLVVLSTTIVELVPIIDAIPAITLGVTFIVLQDRLEGMSVKSAATALARRGRSSSRGREAAESPADS